MDTLLNYSKNNYRIFYAHLNYICKEINKVENIVDVQLKVDLDIILVGIKKKSALFALFGMPYTRGDRKQVALITVLV